MVIRAPKPIVMEWRSKFPGINDSDLINIMWRTSALKFEAWLRDGKYKKK